MARERPEDLDKTPAAKTMAATWRGFQGVCRRIEPWIQVLDVLVQTVRFFFAKVRAIGMDPKPPEEPSPAPEEAPKAREHDAGIEATIFYNDIRAFGKGFERYYETARNERGVRYLKSMVSTVKQLQRSKNLLLHDLCKSLALYVLQH